MRNVSPLSQKINLGRNPPVDNHNPLRKNMSIEDHDGKGHALSIGRQQPVTSFLNSTAKPNSFLQGDRPSSALKLQNNSFLMNRGRSERESSQNSFMRAPQTDFSQTLTGKKPFEPPSKSNLQEFSQPASQLSSKNTAVLAEEQDELIEEHNNQVDDMVACVKEDMAILKAMKDSRGLNSFSTPAVPRADQDLVGAQDENLEPL